MLKDLFKNIMDVLKKIKKTGLDFLYRLCAPLIRFKEKPKIDEFGNKPLKFQPIFIIGAPRTGSTILYQLITNTFDVLYIDNLVCKWRRNFFYGFKKSQAKFGNRPHDIYKSVHGATTKYGEHAPSECGGFWYRWFPTDRHFLDFNEIPVSDLEEIRKNITAVTNYHGKPIVFKNLNAGQRLRVLSKIFPQSKFIWIKRDPLETALSIIKVKRKLNIELNRFWSIMPYNVKDLKKMGGYEQVVKQIYHLEKQIFLDKELLPQENMLILTYDQLVSNTQKELSKIKQFISPQIGERKGAAELEIVKKSVNPDNPDYGRLLEEIGKIDWNYGKE